MYGFIFVLYVAQPSNRKKTCKPGRLIRAQFIVDIWQFKIKLNHFQGKKYFYRGILVFYVAQPPIGKLFDSILKNKTKCFVYQFSLY